MAAKPKIAIIGPGRLGTALALELARAGYGISEVVSRNSSKSKAKSRKLAKKLGARASSSSDARLDAKVVWFCVPDREIASAARTLAARTDWKGKVALHSSGALGSEELRVLQSRGAKVASVHPLMTFVSGSIPSLKNTPIAVEGDTVAVRVSRRIAQQLGAKPFAIRAQDKAAYHAWGAFTSPLLIAALVTAEQVARVAGLSANAARKKMPPILGQTLANYAALGPAAAFSGPIIRGDAEIVRKHLAALKRLPEARDVYVALARAALKYLPSHNWRALEDLLEKT